MWHDSGQRVALWGKKDPKRVAPRAPAISYLVAASILEAACWTPRQLREEQYMHPRNLAHHSHLPFSFPRPPPHSTGTCTPCHPGLSHPVTLVEACP